LLCLGNTLGNFKYNFKDLILIFVLYRIYNRYIFFIYHFFVWLERVGRFYLDLSTFLSFYCYFYTDLDLDLYRERDLYLALIYLYSTSF